MKGPRGGLRLTYYWGIHQRFSFPGLWNSSAEESLKMLCNENEAFRDPGTTDTICKARFNSLNETTMNAIGPEVLLNGHRPVMNKITSASASELKAS